MSKTRATATMTPQAFKLRRGRLGFTQEQLADALGIHRVYVARFEAGSAPISRRTELALKYLEHIRVCSNPWKRIGGQDQ